MAKKIQHSDLVEKNVLQPTIEQVQLLTKSLDAAEQQVKDFAKAAIELSQATKTFSGAEDVEKLNKSTKDLVESEKVLLAIEKEKAKLEKELEKLRAEEFKTKQQELKLDIQKRKEEERQEKIRKKEEKQLKDLDSAYKRQSKRLNELRNNYKDLAAAGRQGEKASRELLQEIQALDKELKDIDSSVGQFQRSVGDYSKQALGSTKATLGWAAALVGLQGGLDDVKTAANANEEGSKDLNKITEQASAVFNTFANRAGQAASGIFDFVKQTIDGEGGIFQFNATLAKITNSFNGVFKAAGNAADAAGQAADEQFELDRASLSLQEQLAKLNGEFERQSAIAGDGTRTFNEQQAAAEEAERVNIRRLALQEEIAQRELQIIEDRIKGTEDDANRFALEAEASEKRIELQELQNELDVATIENDKVLREIQRDRFERELDFAIDAFDVQKTINERRIADDRKSVQERQAILNETVALADSSFQSQKDLFAEFVDDRVNFDNLVAETDEAAIRRTLRKLDLDDIELGRALEVIKERKIALQDLDDAQRDVDDALQEEINTKLEAINELEQLQIEAQVQRLDAEIANEETTNERRIELLNDRFELQKRALEDNADFVLMNEELTAEEREVIQQQLANDVAALEQEKVDAVKEANEEILESDKETRQERIQQALDTANEIKDAFAEALNEQLAAQSAAIDSEINQRQQAIDFNRQLVAQGNTEAAEQLQFEQEQLAKAEIKKKQIAQREAAAKRQIQIVDSFFTAFERRLGDEETPTGQASLAALGDVAKGVAASEIAKALVSASFITGTENVERSLGSGSTFFNDKVDNYLGLTKSGSLIRFDGQERILNPEQNKVVGDLSNDQLTQLAADYHAGNLRQPYEFQTATYLHQVSGLTDNVRLEAKLALLSSAVDRNANIIAGAINDKPVASSYIDSALNVVEEIKRNNKTTRTVHKRF